VALKLRPAIGIRTLARLCTVVAALCAAIAEASPGFPLIKRYSPIDVGTNLPAWTSLQDRDGIIYFGTNSLVTFDGETWRSFPIGSSYGLRGLAMARDGKKIWAGAVGELGWYQRNGNEWLFHSLGPQVPGGLAAVGEIWEVIATNDGAVFISDERVFRWNGQSFESWEFPDSRRLDGFHINGAVYFQHWPTGLYRLDASGPTLVASAQSLGINAIFAIKPDNPEWTLVTNQGFMRLRDGQAHFVPGAGTDYLRKHPTATAVVLPDGRIATGSLDDGLRLWSENLEPIAAFSDHEGITAGLVAPLLIDRTGALWATANAAIFRIALDSPSTVFGARAGVPTQPVHAIIRHNDRLLLATSDGVRALSPSRRQFERVPGATEIVRDLRRVEGALILAGLHGVRRAVNGEYTAVFESETDVMTLGLSRRAPGTFYGDRRRDVLAFAPGAEPKVVVAGLPVVATSIAEAADGTLWMGTQVRGLFVAPLSDATATPRAAPLDLGLPALSGEVRVVATRDGGLVVLNKTGGWIRRAGAPAFVAIEHYPARPIGAVAAEFSAEGALWIVHAAAGPTDRATAAQITLTATGARWQPHSVEGLPEIGIPRSVFAEKLGDGSTTLWIGGSSGVVRNVIDAGPSAPVPDAPQVLASVRLHAGAAATALTSALPHSVQTIAFEFAAPQVMRFPLRVESRIDGIDQDWLPASASGRRELPATRSGRYALRVRAVAETGVTSPEVVVPFEILPPWWRTAPALFAFALAIIPIGFGFHWLRSRTLRRRNAELETKVRERTEELVQANAAKTQFVANMSHDIRNPLNGIVGLALALEDSKLDPRQREVVATLRECTTYLSTLVDDVLDFARIEAGKIELRPGPFAPPELLRSIVETLKTDTAACGATLAVETGAALPPQIVGDAGRIQQIVVNFISNALKYAGGHIHISATVPADAPGEIEFAVADRGPGLSAADQATLFTKFTRVKRAHGTEAIPGTGLGLASCRLMADFMGGSVGVQSAPDQGARFFLRLPLIIATATPPVPAGTLPNSTVLLVEDADYNAWATEAVLARLGLACVRARTGQEALQLFAAKRFNVVLLDRNLPDIDGTEVARQMRQLEAGTGHALLLAVTAYCTAEDRALCLEAGMDAFVGKPLTPEKLRKVMLAASGSMLTTVPVQVDPSAVPAGELDLSLLSYLADGSSAGLETQIDRYIANLDESERQLAAFVPVQNFAALALSAHHLLGQARMIGATALTDAASRLEDAARSEEQAQCSSALARVTTEIQALKAAMRRRRPSSLQA